MEHETGYNLWGNLGRSYKHLYDPAVFDTGKGNEDKGTVMMTTTDEAPVETAQMAMKKGLKVFREQGYAAIKKEMQQLHDRKVMQPINRKDLSPSQKKEALGYLMFLKRNSVAQLKVVAAQMDGSSGPTSLRKNQPRLQKFHHRVIGTNSGEDLDVEFSRPGSPRCYEYACETFHKLSKSKSLSSAQSHLILTMPHDRSFVFSFVSPKCAFPS